MELTMKLIEFEKGLTHCVQRFVMSMWEACLFFIGGAFLMLAVSMVVNMVDGDGMNGRTYVQQVACIFGALPWAAIGFYGCYQRSCLIDEWKKINVKKPTGTCSPQ